MGSRPDQMNANSEAASFLVDICFSSIWSALGFDSGSIVSLSQRASDRHHLVPRGCTCAFYQEHGSNKRLKPKPNKKRKRTPSRAPHHDDDDDEDEEDDVRPSPPFLYRVEVTPLTSADVVEDLVAYNPIEREWRHVGRNVCSATSGDQ